MNENAKTLTFVAAAAAIVALIFLPRLLTPVAEQESMRNKPLFSEFADPLQATDLEIVEYDEGRGDILPFQITQTKAKSGKALWAIPSHNNYPADAKDQMAAAAVSMMGLKVLEEVSDNEGDQREFGVIDPDPKKGVKAGETGVGQRVVMKDKDGKELLALVIGKEVPGRAGLRYVRRVGESPIYIVPIKTDKLSTKFENWIERDLLKISGFDIKRLWIRDHSVDEMNAALIQRGETQIEFDDAAKPQWKLVEDKKFATSKDKPGEGQWVPVKMAADEELNTAKLDELKNALNDLKIVDVNRKPAGLSADLKTAADFSTHRDAIASLAQRGFFVAELTKGQVELFSNEGEIRIVMKDGVEYVLRFGEVAGASKKDDKSKDAKKDAEKNPEKKSDGLNRYLFVMAEFNPNIIPKPQFDPLPEAKKPEEAKPAAEKKPDDKKPDEKKPEAKKPDEKKPDDAKVLEEKRKEVEKENKRKQEEYDQKIADGKKRVAELNERFADWYYVISDDVYRKIHLGHDAIVKKKEKAKDKKDEHAGHDHEQGNLDSLKQEGLEGK